MSDFLFAVEAASKCPLSCSPVSSRPSQKLQSQGRPHTAFHLRAESDGQIWKITAFDEDEIGGLDTLAIGDACAVTGSLDVHAAEDRQGRRRIAFCIVAKQLMPLRSRSPVKASASNFSCV